MDKDDELVLCFSKELIKGVDVNDRNKLRKCLMCLLNTPGLTLFRRRGDVENDERFLQIIPYCFVQQQDNEYNLLVCRRNKYSGEKRLHNSYSIGFGGHVNLSDAGMLYKRNITAIPMVVRHPSAILDSCVIREVNEEIRYVEMPTIASKHPDDTTSSPPRAATLIPMQTTIMLMDDSNPVSRMHIGIVYRVAIAHPEHLSIKEDCFDEAQWVSVNDLVTDEWQEKLESWSRIIAKEVYTAMS